jgi:hypothetical protein
VRCNRLRRLTLAAALTVAGVLTVGTAGPVGASHWVYLDGLGDGGLNTAAADRNHDGAFDIVYSDVDYDRAWDVALWDQDHNGAYEWVWAKALLPQGFYLHDHNGDGYWEHGFFDLDGNGLFEVELWDGDRDGVFEWVAVDYSGDGRADTWVSGAPATPSTSAAAQTANDTMVQHIVMMNQLRQCLRPGRC